MKPFLFKKFAVQQHKHVFRVGTDGVLLGALANVEVATNILEVGTGTGLVSLMIAQRNTIAKITAVDFNPLAVEIATKNFGESPFFDRTQALQCDFNEFEADNKFDLIISNPPYFEPNPSEKDISARQQRELSFQSLIRKTAEILTESGRFIVIIPSSAGVFFVELCLKYKLHLTHRFTVYGNENVQPKRVILEFDLVETQKVNEETFIIEKAPRIYSDQYLKATEQFHVFS